MGLLNKKIDKAIWSIKVFKSNNIISEKPDDVLLNTASINALDVSDVPAEFVADPFLISDNSKYYLFFEVLNKRTERGEIGLATSRDGCNWSYQRIILKESYHLSYPYVFKYGDQFYMIPESLEANGVFLYRAISFPYEWEKVYCLIKGKFVDPSIFYYQDKWWMFVGTPEGNLHLYYSYKIEKGWIEHNLSPIVTRNYNISRPGGRVIVDNDKIYRFTQDSVPYYGKQVRAFIINKLTEKDYQENEICIVLNGSNSTNDWRKDGIHHIDQLKIDDHNWLVAVDGHVLKKEHYLQWKLKSIIRNPASNINRMLKKF